MIENISEQQGQGIDQNKESSKIPIIDLIRSSIVRSQHKKFDADIGAIASASFDGTSLSLEIATGNVTSDQNLRQFGLLHTIPSILKNICLLFDEENLGEVKEIIITHGKTTLIKIKNAGKKSVWLDTVTLDIEAVTTKMCEENVRCPSLTKRKLMAWFRNSVITEEPKMSRMRNFFIVCAVSFSFGLVAWFKSRGTIPGI